ncbi:SRPBCC family protein [Solimicrobium silvestre]|uniref:DUF1857 domain-containing protein n=1 Tax=Solimicrobium silvestre TaxID=2099400 RepID=A0A2S9GSE4_9BURK|nr:SRPBCC family protein [Solimicrobium silvestre]PRC90633.1 hypothetical protein S2091_4669 [Solimicrobium silvestre]
MKFEHLIEINDLNNPFVPMMTREQLWNGLVLRAEFPKLFVSYLDACNITSRDLDSLTRTLQFGDLKVNDHVHFNFLNFVHYQVHQQGEIPESSMRMTIEEPASQALFVRFSYDDGHTKAEDIENATYNEYRRSAYVEADIETVKILREMHDNGRLDSLLT